MRRNLVIEEILISATPFGVRTALVSDGHIRAFYAESHARPRLLDNIYKAAPGRQGGAARFVTIAAGQSAYMSEASGTNADTADAIVQVVRASAAGKAPRVSTAPALAGRYLVYFPHGANANVARRIDDEAERARLLAIGQSLSATVGSVTLRSAAEGMAEELLRAEAARLRSRWSDIVANSEKTAAPALLLAGPTLAERLLRDAPPGAVKRILVDDRTTLANLSAYAEQEAPEMRAGMEFAGDVLFERHDAASALSAALAPEVALPGGGRLTIEPTQALTVIDVDSGARTGGREAVLRATCTEAATAAAAEIRRRNLAGLIVIDFPRLSGADARAALLADMRAKMSDDPTAHKVVKISASGLMEITRRRAETPLLQVLTEAAAGDDHDGYGGYGGRQARLDALAFDIADQARHQVRAGMRRMTLHMAPELADYFARFDSHAGGAENRTLGEWLGAEITVRHVPEYRRDKWLIETTIKSAAQ